MKSLICFLSFLSSFQIVAMPAAASERDIVRDVSSDRTSEIRENSATVMLAEFKYARNILVHGVPFSSGIRIMRDGSVISFQETGYGNTTDLIVTLGEKKLAALIEKIDSLKETPLVDINPHSTDCLILGTVFYTITNSSQKTFPIFKIERCHRFSNGQSQTDSVMKVLDTLRSLEGALMFP